MVWPGPAVSLFSSTSERVPPPQILTFSSAVGEELGDQNSCNVSRAARKWHGGLDSASPQFQSSAQSSAQYNAQSNARGLLSGALQLIVFPAGGENFENAL